MGYFNFTNFRLTEEQKNQALVLIGNCETKARVAEILGFSCREAFQAYRKTDPVFDEAINAARDEGLEDLILSLLKIPDEYMDHPHIARIKCDNVIKIVEKLNPARFGNRIDLNVSQNLNIEHIMINAESRMQRLVEPTQAIDTTSQLIESSKDMQSVLKVDDLF